MDNLDRLLREQYGRTPPADPPPEGWARLADRLRQPDDEDPPPPPWWQRSWPLLLVLSLAMVGTAAWVWQEPAPAPQPTIRPHQIADKVEGGGATRQPDGIRGLVREQKLPTAQPMDDVGKNGPNIPEPATERMVRIRSSLPSEAIPPTTPYARQPGASSTTGPEQAHVAASPGRQVEIIPRRHAAVAALPHLPRPRLRSLSYTPTRILERTGILDELVMAASSTGTRARNGRRDPWVFRRTLHYVQPPAVWEVTGRAFAWPVGEADGFRQQFQEEPGGMAGGSRRFLLPGGDPIRLYPAGNARWQEYPGTEGPRFSLLTAGIEVAYRTPRGFRFSLGGVLTRSPGRSEIDHSSIVGTLAAGEYLLLERDLGIQEYWMTLGVQYTINRRRRLRINVGVQALGMIYETYGREEYLVGPDLEEPAFVSRLTTANGNFLSWVLPVPQVTFDYQLRRNLTLSAGIGGMSGLGVSYNFARRSWNPPPATFY